ncbi:hypothetical protein MMC32_003741 [Xylographa parallela]|nr:hypothetical protein [Xylographa parallela]
MPFVINTPESRLSRSDSKDPSTTCRGITLSGKPCKRSIAALARACPATTVSVQQGYLVVAPSVAGRNEEASAFFCWSHKDQAEILAPLSRAIQSEALNLRKRTSVDTMVERLEVLDIKESCIKENCGSSVKKSTGQTHRSMKRSTLPKQGRNDPGPLTKVPEESLYHHEKASLPRVRQPQQRRRQKGSLIFHLSFFFCIRDPGREDEHTPPPRIRAPLSARHPPEMAQMRHTQSRHRLSAAQHSSLTTPPNISYPQTSPDIDRRPPLNHSPLPRSQTHTLLALIPPTLPPQTTSLLLAELAKPLPPSSEPGYIYMFWLTPDSTPAPSPDTASALLAPPTISRRRTSDVLRPFAPPTPTTPPAPPTLLLKIGRASNVQRRLNEWTRQCGYNLSLVRYYPYHPSSPTAQPPSPARSPPRPRPSSGGVADGAAKQGLGYPHKVPHVARVERLIQLELAEKRVKRVCAGCAKEHREWFEVEATREGLRAVDEVVRRWVGWGAGLGES